MALSIPYPGSTSGYQGNVTESQAVLNAWVERVHRAGIQLNCHANGAVAIDSVLKAYARAQRHLPAARHTAEDHALNIPRRIDQVLDSRGQVGRLCIAGRRSARCRAGPDQGHSHRAHDRRRKDGVPGLILRAQAPASPQAMTARGAKLSGSA